MSNIPSGYTPPPNPSSIPPRPAPLPPPSRNAPSSPPRGFAAGLRSLLPQAPQGPESPRTPRLPVGMHRLQLSEIPLGNEGGIPSDAESDQIHEGIAGPAVGEVLTDEFRYDGEVVAQEKAERSDTVGMLAKGLAGRREYLNERSVQLAGVQAELLVLRGEVAKSQTDPPNEAIAQRFVEITRSLRLIGKEHLEVLKMLEVRTEDDERAAQAKADGNTWAGSSTYRNQVAQSASPEDAHREYLPVLPNLRVHTVTDKDGVELTRLNRSGAIHDYRHGYTNLQELRMIRAVLANFVESEDDSRGVTQDQYQILAQLSPELKGALEAGDSDQALVQLDKQIADRVFILQNQAVQDLAMHFQGMTAEELNAMPPEVLFGRVSLLNGHAPPNRGEGWEIREPNQILDMAAIYGDLSGKDLIFDGRGPFVDDLGRIHLPQKAVDAHGDVVIRSFKPIFFNISAQVNVSNTGVQQPINKKALGELIPLVSARCEEWTRAGREDEASRLLEDLEFVQARLNSNNIDVEDGFELAERTLLLLQAVDAKISINCFSGKDRTGMLASQLTLHHLGRLLRQKSARNIRKTLGRWGCQLLRGSGIACRVVEDNTRYRALKLDVKARYKPFSVGSLRQRLFGTAKKAGMVRDAAMTFVRQGQGQLGGGMLFPNIESAA